MPRLILLLAAIGAGWLVYRHLQSIPAGQRRGAYLKVGLSLLVILIIFATVTGRMHWIGAAVTALVVGAGRLLPTLIRLFPMLQWLRQRPANSAGRQSKVETRLLRMVLDHASGAMSGVVLAGDLAGQSLEEMDRDQLDTLLNQFQQQDEDSARLLQTYLAWRFGQQEQYRQTGNFDNTGNMPRQEALAILGLEEAASKREIADAHRRLMQKLHPDRGGSDYLAAKLNQAKDSLLG